MEMAQRDAAVAQFRASRPDEILPRKPGVGGYEYRLYVARQESRLFAWRLTVEAFAKAVSLDVDAFVRDCEQA